MPQRNKKPTAYLLTVALLLPLVAADRHKSKPSHHPENLSKRFVIDPDRPFVYLKFDRVGKGDVRCYDELTRRVWLHLVNNSTVPISIHAGGLPQNCPYDQIDIMFEVVPDKEPAVISGQGSTVSVPPLTFPGTPAMGQKPAKIDASKEVESEEVPHGNMFDVSTGVLIPPDKSIPISLPISDLGKNQPARKNWHVEIPFEFDVPRGKGPRNPVIGGAPSMVIIYSLADLPSQALE